MDGIFVAYHNTVRCLGFQYLPLSELDQRLFGSTEIATQVFSLCVGVLERILDEASSMFPGKEVSLTINHRRPEGKGGEPVNQLEVTAQPLVWDEPGPMPTRAMLFTMRNKLDGGIVGDEGIEVPQFSDDPVEQREQECKCEREGF